MSDNRKRDATMSEGFHDSASLMRNPHASLKRMRTPKNLHKAYRWTGSKSSNLSRKSSAIKTRQTSPLARSISSESSSINQLIATVQLLVNQLNMTPPTLSTGEGAAGATAGPAADAAPHSTYIYRPVMPHPGQPGALHFDGRNVSEFIRKWEMGCRDYGYHEGEDKCGRLPDYYSESVKDVVELFDGYTSLDWEIFKKELKSFYWDQDIKKNDTSALNKLIQDAPTLDLTTFVLKYSAISSHLVTAQELSNLQRCRKLLDGLPDHLKNKAIEFCSTQQWRLSSKEADGTEPVFEDLVNFVKGKAQAVKKREVYEQERAMELPSSASASHSVASSYRPTPPDSHLISSNELSMPAVAPIPTPASTPSLPPTRRNNADSSIDSLAEQFSKMTLALQASIRSLATNRTQESSLPSQLPSASTQRPPRPFPSRCIWCDSESHTRNSCAEFLTAFNEGKVKLNEKGRVIDAKTGNEIPTLFRNGGMKMFYSLTTTSQPSSVPSVNNITVEMVEHASLGSGNTVTVSTIDFENDTCVSEVIDADVFEKRKRVDGKPLFQRKRMATGRRDADADAPAEEIMDMDEATPVPGNSPSVGTPSPQPQPVMNAPKYRLASKLSETISVGSVSEKIMDSSIVLSLREALAVSSDLSSYLHQQTKKHRLPVTQAGQPNPAPVNTSGNATTASVNQSTALYAAPSSRAKAVIDGSVARWALLDHGSEVCLMPKRTYEALDYPIDTDVKWVINGFGGKDGNGGVLGVCYDLRINVGGVEVKIPVFVMENCGQDLLLGRPWERAVRASFSNEPDGSVLVQIKSPDGRRVVKFTGVAGDHERNRYHARLPDGERDGEGDYLNM